MAVIRAPDLAIYLGQIFHVAIAFMCCTTFIMQAATVCIIFIGLATCCTAQMVAHIVDFLDFSPTPERERQGALHYFEFGYKNSNEDMQLSTECFYSYLNDDMTGNPNAWKPCDNSSVWFNYDHNTKQLSLYTWWRSNEKR
jgi:hypothetical protein